MSKTILVIPDPHDDPAVSKDRFKWAGRLIVDRQPDAIVHMGDGITLDSLSQYDTGTALAEGRRYEHDIASFQEAMNELHAPVEQYNKTIARKKKKKYQPDLIYCEGNHECRIPKACNKDPKLIGTISLADLRLQERGWQYYPLTVPAEVYGIAFAHYFTSGIMGKPISGIHHARSLVAKTYTNTVVGHSHTRDFWEDTDVYGNKVMGLVAGCYFEHELCYTKEEDRNWSGLILLSVSETEVNPEFIPMERIKKDYA